MSVGTVAEKPSVVPYRTRISAWGTATKLPVDVAERPGLSRLGDVHPPQRRRTVRLVLKLLSELIEERPHPHDTPISQRRDGHAVDTGGALVGCHLDPCPPHNVAAGDLVVESVEPPSRILLALRYSTR
jgi:hypothetical protein